MPDPTPDVPRRTLPAREAITFARGSVADARRALAAARPASRPAPERVQAAARAADAAVTAAGGASAVLAHVDAPATMRAASARLRDPYRCNSDPRVDRLLADWLDSAAYDAEEIGPDFRAERVAAAILDRPDPHPGAPSPTQVRASLARGRDDREQLDPATAASVARGLAQSAEGDVRDLGDFPATIPPPISWASSVLGEVPQYADDEPGELIGEARPHCQDPSCPDFGDPDFGEGTCPASHAEPRNDEQARNRHVQGAKLLWAADRGDVAPWMFDKLTDPDLLDLCIMARRLIQATHREQNRRRAEPAGRVPQ